jgi:hypothetical protein
MENKLKTAEVEKCTSFEELKEVFKKYSPFISKSRLEEVVWTEDKLLGRLEKVISGYPVNYITKVCGIRAKVLNIIEASSK